MFGKFKGWFTALSSIGKVGFIAAVVAVGLIANAASHPQTKNTTAVEGTSTEAPKVVTEHKTVSTTEEIKFDTKTVDNPNLTSGTDQTQTEGVNGVKTITYDVTLTNGVETNRTLNKEEVTTAPVIKVISHGTYVAPAPVLNCPNGTYVNTAGNTVCSPYSAPTTPAGATAQCRDGSYSFSQSRSGTCSHHGGVATWL